MKIKNEKKNTLELVKLELQNELLKELSQSNITRSQGLYAITNQVTLLQTLTGQTITTDE